MFVSHGACGVAFAGVRQINGLCYTSRTLGGDGKHRNMVPNSVQFVFSSLPSLATHEIICHARA